MATALAILSNFALILLGLALARLFGYAREFWSGLEKLVYYVLFPALLLRSLATTPIDFAAAGVLIGGAWAFTLPAIGLAIAARALLRLERGLVASVSQCGYRFNTYVGLAVAGSLFGPRGVALAALLLGSLIPLVNFAAVGMLARHGERGLFTELVRNPLLVATLAGFAWNAAGLAMPAFAGETLALLGQASLPAGLLTVGAAMRIEPGQGPARAHAWWLTVKMAIAPAIAWAFARSFAIHGAEAQVLVLCAALPTATTAYILAVRMGGEAPRAVALQITVGTVLAMATLPAWMALARARL